MRRRASGREVPSFSRHHWSRIDGAREPRVQIFEHWRQARDIETRTGLRRHGEGSFQPIGRSRTLHVEEARGALGPALGHAAQQALA